MSHAIYPSLEGRAVLVTGGGSGIGEAIVRRFAEQGAKTAFVDIAVEASEALVADLKAKGQHVTFKPCDVTDTAKLRATIAAIRAEIGPITVLINNAAHDQRHNFLEVTPEFFDDRVAVNFKHMFFAAQAVVPDMIAAGGGSIVNFGSVSWLMGSADLTVYGAMKAASHGFTRMLAHEFGKDNIRVNCILPGWIMTERQKTLWLDAAGEAAIQANQSLKRKMQPDDIAKTVLFLASEESSGMTRQTIVVDGGWT